MIPWPLPRHVASARRSRAPLAGGRLALRIVGVLDAAASCPRTPRILHRQCRRLGAAPTRHPSKRSDERLLIYPLAGPQRGRLGLVASKEPELGVPLHTVSTRHVHLLRRVHRHQPHAAAHRACTCEPHGLEGAAAGAPWECAHVAAAVRRRRGRGALGQGALLSARTPYARVPPHALTHLLK